MYSTVARQKAKEVKQQMARWESNQTTEPLGVPLNMEIVNIRKILNEPTSNN